jgi:transglutaminase-like putative cysteine protease
MSVIGVSWARVLGLLGKLAAVVVAVAAPALGVWLASSLAAYRNGSQWGSALIGLALFPLLPLAWEAFAAWRRSRRPPRLRVLTFFDRLVVRTLAVNLVFLGAALWALPEQAFRALSTRGDWMLDGRDGGTANRVRAHLFATADVLEGLYTAARDNPYDRDEDDAPAPGGDEPAPDGDGTSPAATRPPDGDGDGDGDGDPAAPPHAAWPVEPRPHALAAAVPAGAQTDAAAVARWIAEREPDPFLRVKALHDYVVARLTYDHPAVLTGDIPPQDAATVFGRRTAVCAGYAQLLEAMGAAAGVEIAYVVGDSRRDEEDVDGVGHAWNAAHIGDRWYLVDATWDDAEDTYRTDYLFTPPELFSLDHLPDAERWQLRDRPLSRGDFMRQPMLEPRFYQHGLELRQPTRSQVTVGDRVDIVLGNPREVFVTARAEPLAGGGDVVRCDVRPGATVRITCDLPEPGRYRVILFAALEEYGVYPGVGRIQVNRR